MSFKTIKAITIGAVSEMTGLSERQIRYYEDRKLIFPDRSNGGTRKYSFDDIEKLVEISKKVNKGVSTYNIRQQENKKQQEQEKNQSRDIREKMLQGQINAAFRAQHQSSRFNRY
ncbi:MerR family transcriptional regulator [Bacillus cereus]|uniref:MerR family transcriptional regulator n=1 Tax=Bacillus cereus TaxID=1396 RepID=UPI00307ABB39